MGAKALSAPPPARCLPYTLYWTYVSLSLCDRCQWRIHFSVEEFNFKNSVPSSFKTLYSCLYFMVSVSLTLIIWFKNLAFSERNSKAGDNHSPQPREVVAVWKYILIPASRCILHQSTGSEFLYTGVYISWQRSVLIYIDLGFSLAAYYKRGQSRG